jgi:hypothetical protein
VSYLDNEPGGLTFDEKVGKLSILPKYDIKNKEGTRLSNKLTPLFRLEEADPQISEWHFPGRKSDIMLL